MKKLLIILPAFLLIGCPGHMYHDDDYIQTEYEPVIVSRDDLDKTIKILPPRKINEAGKIYRQGDMLFINEKYDGIHVINNGNPADPKKLAFLAIPGNINLSMIGDIMYVDHAGDLVSMRYNGEALEILDRNPEVFPELLPPDVNYIPLEYQKANRPDNTVIINWKEK